MYASASCHHIPLISLPDTRVRGQRVLIKGKAMSIPRLVFAPVLRRAALALCLSLCILSGNSAAFAADATPPAAVDAPPASPTPPTPPPPPPATDPSAGNGGSDGLAQIWLTRADDLTALMAEATALQRDAEEEGKPLAAGLQNSRAQFTRLSGLFQASRGHPTEQLTLVQQMRGLRNNLRNNIAPLEGVAATISEKLAEIGKLQKDLEDISKESAADGVNLSRDAEGLKTYTRNLADAQKKLKIASRRLETILAPAKATLARIEQLITEIEGSLEEVWESYYLTPSVTTMGTLASTPAMLGDWASSLNSRMGFAYPQSLPEWLETGKTFALTIFVMAVIGFLALRGARIFTERWRRACEHVITRAWVWVGIGFAVLTASANQYGGYYFALVFLGSLIIIAGVAAMSWRLRIAALPRLQRQPSPLMRLYPPAAIGVFMLFSDLPTRVLGIIWSLIMVASLTMFFYRNRKRSIEVALPLLERLAYGCALYFGAASFLVAMAGYARLAILLFMLLFALVNTVLLGNALTALFDMLANRLLDKERVPVRNALARAVVIPFAWVLSLLCTLPWIWAVPGARYLMLRAMSANYTVGHASFDFSKILFIAVLFFLFRSFINLGKTSLEHLPNRMPYIERGVIPSLSFMLTYGFWTIFGLISLGLLGVDFTSLAVVAGGLSVGIGFGMQNIFNNLISGLMLIFGRTILVGDVVDVAGASGTVKAINIRSTVLLTSERALIYVPNSAIMAGQLTNWTRNSRMVRRSIAVGVAYGSDTTLVTRLLTGAAEQQEHVLKNPAPSVFFSNFGAHSLDFTLNVFIDDLDNATPTLSAIRFEIDRFFHENDIDIPFPQLTLHMPPSGPGGASGPGAAALAGGAVS